MSQPTASQVVALLGIDPSTLPLAPADLIAAGARPPAPCLRCDAPGAVILIATTALGHRWVDLCEHCFHWATTRR